MRAIVSAGFPQSYARIGGMLYLLIIAAGLFAEFVRERFVVPATQRPRLAHHGPCVDVSPRHRRRSVHARVRGRVDGDPLCVAEAVQPQRGFSHAWLQLGPGCHWRPQCAEHIQAPAASRRRRLVEGLQPGAIGGDGLAIAQYTCRRLQHRHDVFWLFCVALGYLTFTSGVFPEALGVLWRLPAFPISHSALHSSSLPDWLRCCSRQSSCRH
jgi:hypothetical protein